MQRTPKAAIIVALLLVTLIPLPVQAGDSGGVQAGVAQLALTPENPVMGGSVDIEVGLYNSAQSDAFNVQVAFYKNSIATQNRLLQDEITIPGESFVEVSVTWNGLTEGVQKVWFEFSAGGDIPVSFNQEFTVQGLPNLRIDTASIDQSQPVYSGDTVDFSALVMNSGSVDAGASNMLLSVPESADVILSTPALLAGSSAWVNTTITAPSSGIHMIEATPDIDNLIYEASETGKTESVQLVVSSRMDLSFKDGLTVTSDAEALEGPWLISGTIVRTNGTGAATIPMVLEINNPLGGVVMGAPFTVQILGTGYAEQAFSSELNSSTIGSLPDGDHVVTARINPFNEVGFEQESTENDEASGMLTISPIPDVNVDPPLCTACTVQSGDDVEWRITVTNTGDKAVRGYIEYTFDGINGQSPQITLTDGEILTWTVSLPTNLGEHEALFNGNWVAAEGSWDDNKQNSKFSTSAQVESKLKLSWEYASLQIIDADGQSVGSPLQDGASYTLSINMTSKETGSANFSCDDGSENILATLATNVAERGDRVSLSCTFTATAAMTTIRIIPEETSIADLFSMSFTTLAPTDDAGGVSSSDAGTMTLFGIGAFILVGVLVAAILLTREREEEVERDIFDYCPACDGELEGTEDKCPHCSFNLKKARSQFHDCKECGESIPDLLDNCAYCGAEQDVSSYFEQRERKVRKEVVKETVALPEEEDEDRIVTGTQNFAETVKEFGFDEEHLEEEWDANIEAAEAEVEAAYDRRHADEVALEDMTEEEVETYKSQVVTTLKSSRDESPDHDFEAILASKGELRSLAKEDGELSASDAGIRERLFEITGEEGVLPGEKVTVGMTLTDSALAGNEVAEATANFTFEDDDLPLSASTKTADEQREDTKARKPVRRRSSRQRKKEEADQDVAEQTSECGACGADLPLDADECGTCGARFS
ncbi:MAG: hypothetical protein HOK85_03015 [Euryarchaeota archaeon]|nr:hypothetical protein [Euryarchaeota archaeon]